MDKHGTGFVDLTITDGWFKFLIPQDVLDLEPGTRAYQKQVSDGHLTVLVAQYPTDHLWHMSISHRSSTLTTSEGNPLPGRLPSWPEIKEARYRFIPNECVMAMILPPKESYVGIHPTTFHLWELPKEIGKDFQ